MMLMVALAVTISQVYVKDVKAYTAQTAADSISDGVAVQMAKNRGSYDDAVEAAESLMKTINKETNSNILKVVVDKDEFQENRIKVTVYSSDFNDVTGEPTGAAIKTSTTEFESSYSAVGQQSMPGDYKQYDSAWGSYHVGLGMTMSEAGCGICSMADIVEVPPTEIADIVRNAGYMTSDGLSWSAPSYVIPKYGFKVTKQGTNTSWLKECDNKNTFALVSFGSSSIWTSSPGHLICFKEYEASSNRFYITNPSSSQPSGWYDNNSNTLRGLKRIWIIERIESHD